MPDQPNNEKRAAKCVSFPNVVGRHFLKGRDMAWSAGVTLANPDPDGPPIGAVVWPNDPIIQKQDPAPGSTLYEHDSLRVWLGPDWEPNLARILENPPSSVDSAQASPEQPTQTIDLTRNIGPDKTAPQIVRLAEVATRACRRTRLSLLRQLRR